MRRHAGGVCKRELPILHSSKCSLESKTRRVSAAGVVEGDWLAWLGLRKSGREIEHWADTVELSIGLRADVNYLS